MPWDKSNCIFSLPFRAWSKGNGTSNKNTGNMPSYPNGAWQNNVFTSMGAGYGYLYNAGSGYCNYDGNNDAIITAKKLSWTNTNKITFEFNVGVNLGNYMFFGGSYQFGGDSSWLSLYVLKYTDSNYNQLSIAIGPGGYGAISSTRITTGVRVVHFIKDGANFRIYIDGVECSYAYTKAYNVGNRTDDRFFQIGNRPYDNIYSWFPYINYVNIYDDAISQARITQNVGLGPDLGEVANNVGDEMIFGAGTKKIIPAGIFEGSH